MNARKTMPGLTRRGFLTASAAAASARLVGLGESDGVQDHNDLLQTLISDPRLPGVIDDIVVPADLTSSWWIPAIFLDPAYGAGLQRRNSLQGDIVDLNTYRQQQLPVYPPLAAAAC